jgi:hypothetical protein
MVDLEPARRRRPHWLRDRVQRHLDETGSAVAERPARRLGRRGRTSFVKVIPT